MGGSRRRVSTAASVNPLSGFVAREGVVAITVVRVMEGCRWWSLMVW